MTPPTPPAVRYWVRDGYWLDDEAKNRLEPDNNFSRVPFVHYDDHARIVGQLEQERERLRGLLQRATIEMDNEECDKVRGSLLSQIEDALKITPREVEHD